MNQQLIVSERLFIAATPQDLWEFTQDELNHPIWKSYCTAPKILESRPHRLIRFEDCRGLSGVWTYEPRGKGTVWSQTNTLTCQSRLQRWLCPLLRMKLRWLTRLSMKKAKEALEFSDELSGSLHEDFF